MPNTLAIKVKPAAERSIRQQHPWVFENSIVRQSAEGQAGDVVVVFDQKKNRLLAVGLYDPASPIRVKLISFGEPATTDAAFFQKKAAEAFLKRKPLLETDTNSYRLLHGENDGFPGLIADVYAGVLVLKIYSPIWIPYLSDLLPAMKAATGCQTIVLRLSRNLQRDPVALSGLSDGQVLSGILESEEVIFREYGLRFAANVIKGHKTGFFLDHRHNRKRVGELAKGKTVLDVFSYAGGFSVHALAGGAREVVSLDISEQALDMAKKNVALNFTDQPHRTLAMDAFEGMEQLYRSGKKFDLVVVDPPSFAKKESEIPKALHSYARLTRLAVHLTQPGGIFMMASCSSRVTREAFFETVEKEIKKLSGKVNCLDKTFHDVDHPIGFPEGSYLKAGYYRR